MKKFIQFILKILNLTKSSENPSTELTHDEKERARFEAISFNYQRKITYDEMKSIMEKITVDKSLPAKFQNAGHLYYESRFAQLPKLGSRKLRAWALLFIDQSITTLEQFKDIQRNESICSDFRCASPFHTEFKSAKKEVTNEEPETLKPTVKVPTKTVKAPEKAKTETLVKAKKTLVEKAVTNGELNLEFYGKVPFKDITREMKQLSRGLCYTSKVTYVNEQRGNEAQNHLRNQLKGKVTAKKIESYPCPSCNYWHITTHAFTSAQQKSHEAAQKNSMRRNKVVF